MKFPIRSVCCIWLLVSLNCLAQSPSQITERNARFDTAVVTPGFEQPLSLLGTATWSEHYLPLFMAGLYAPQGTRTDQVANELTPKRLELVWRNKLLSPERIQQWWQKKFRAGFANQEQWQRNQARVEQYLNVLLQQPANERWVFEYQPDVGTILYVGGKKALHFVGSDINRILWKIWLGEQASPNFRKNITGELGL